MYFEKPGRENTEKTISIAKEEAIKRGIKKVLVASTYGDTGVLACKAFKETGIKVIVITHNCGFKEIGEIELTEEARKTIEDLGGKVLTGTMVLRSLGTAIRDRFGYSEQEIVAATLRMLCQGMKVCAEMAAMAADHGLVGNEDVIAIAGTGRGADTAVVLRPAPSNRFFDIKIREILAKPKEF